MGVVQYCRSQGGEGLRAGRFNRGVNTAATGYQFIKRNLIRACLALGEQR